jgi:hypothetical protein
MELFIGAKFSVMALSHALLRIVLATSVCQRMENFNQILTYARGTLGNGGIRMYMRQGKHG